MPAEDDETVRRQRVERILRDIEAASPAVQAQCNSVIMAWLIRAIKPTPKIDIPPRRTSATADYRFQ
jgi:hypothetical protein